MFKIQNTETALISVSNRQLSRKPNFQGKFQNATQVLSIVGHLAQP